MFKAGVDGTKARFHEGKRVSGDVTKQPRVNSWQT